MGGMFYFGCWNDIGHYLHDRHGVSVRSAGPFDPSKNIDGIFVPMSTKEDERLLNLAHTNGWTVLAMWDRSVDARPGSNAAFLVEGMLTEMGMRALAIRDFPRIVERLVALKAAKTLDVYLHSDKGAMRDNGASAGLTGEALDTFKYVCCEVKLTLAVELDGAARITHVDGRRVE